MLADSSGERLLLRRMALPAAHIHALSQQSPRSWFQTRADRRLRARDHRAGLSTDSDVNLGGHAAVEGLLLAHVLKLWF
jgi:hypothetical protein